MDVFVGYECPKYTNALIDNARAQTKQPISSIRQPTPPSLLFFLFSPTASISVKLQLRYDTLSRPNSGLLQASVS